jgi:hypothetical protein
MLLSNCAHYYHKECTKNYLQAQLSESKCPIACPECKKELGMSDFIGILTPMDIEKYYNYSL